MKNAAFPWITLGTGLTISLVLLAFATENSRIAVQIPLLTILLMSEFCFVVNGIAAGMCAHQLVTQGFNKIQLFLLLANLAFVVYLLFAGLQVWRGITSQ